jgi:hypothetical protein
VGDIERTASHIIRIRSDRDLDPVLKPPGQLTLSVSGRNASAVVSDWSPERAAEVEQLSGAPIDVEALGLEEIFLAVHA